MTTQQAIWSARHRQSADGIAYIAQGAGPTMLLLHGVGLRAESWAAQIAALSAQFTVVAVDLPGHGESAQLTAATLPDYIETLHKFIASLPSPVFLAGHSFGALLALKIAARHPESIAAVAALNCVYRRTPAVQRAVLQRAEAMAADDIDTASPVSRWFGESPAEHVAAAAAACRRWLQTANRQGYADAYMQFAHCDGASDAELDSLTMPALFLTGTDDLNSSPQMSQTMATAAPRGRAAIIEGGGHMMMMTHDAAVTGYLTDFFTKADCND